MQNTEIVSVLLTFVIWRSILKMLGGQKAVFFVIWPGKGTAGKVFLYKIKKSAPSAQTKTNEMTLELSHLSPTIKQGSFLFYFSI